MKSTCSVCWILVALLLIVIAANVQANVIINKEYSPEEHIVKGKPVTVTVRIYNMGSEE